MAADEFLCDLLHPDCDCGLMPQLAEDVEDLTLDTAEPLSLEFAAKPPGTLEELLLGGRIGDGREERPEDLREAGLHTGDLGIDRARDISRSDSKEQELVAKFESF